MSTVPSLTIVDFEPVFQDAANSLIHRGLSEYFGAVDPGRNPDLLDIAAAYDVGFFLAFDGDALIGTGGLRHETTGCCRLARMSVKSSHRRSGVGRALVARLLATARAQHYERVVLETTVGWEAAIAFYLHNGFRIVDEDIDDGNVHFERRLIEPFRTERRAVAGD